MDSVILRLSVITSFYLIDILTCKDSALLNNSVHYRILKAYNFLSPLLKDLELWLVSHTENRWSYVEIYNNAIIWLRDLWEKWILVLICAPQSSFKKYQDSTWKIYFSIFIHWQGLHTNLISMTLTEIQIEWVEY